MSGGAIDAGLLQAEAARLFGVGISSIKRWRQVQRQTGSGLGEAVVTAALPMLVIVAMLGVQYQVAETEAASALFISMVGSLITMGAFIWRA